LGLLVAPSGAGFAIGIAALLLFMARTPLKAVLVDRWRHRQTDRARLALVVGAGELVVVAILGVIAIVTAEAPFWWPLLVALPLVVVELWFDMRSRSRRLVPELAGSVGVGSVAASVALAGGTGSRIAAGLWLLMAARSVAAIAFVRVQLLRAKGQRHRVGHSDLGQAVTTGAVVVGWASGLLPWMAMAAIGCVAVFAVVMVRRPPVAAVMLGAQQVVIGLGIVMAVGLAVVAP
jgi:hypothetical protein